MSLLVAVVAYGCGGGKSGVITGIGTPSPDLPVPSTTGASALPSCDSTATPAVGTWRAMSMQGAPPATPVMRGVWTGSELAVIEPDPQQQRSPVSLNAYDPILDRWRNIPVPTNVAFTPRMNPYLGVVTGKLIVYGGQTDQPPDTPGYLTDGWVIDLNALTWTPMATGPQLWPANDNFPRVFADGSRAVFLPGEDYVDVKDVAVATYDLSTDTWETVPSPPSTNGFFGCDAPAWNGGQALCLAADCLYTVTSSPLAIEPFPSLFVTGVGSTVVSVFSPVGDMFLGLGPSATPGAQEIFWVDPTRQIWSQPAQVPGLGSMVATVNGQVLVWGMGPLTTTSTGTPTDSLVADVYDPVAGVWSPVTCAGAPTWPIGGLTVATPSGLIVFNGSGYPTAAAGVLEL